MAVPTAYFYIRSSATSLGAHAHLFLHASIPAGNHVAVAHGVKSCRSRSSTVYIKLQNGRELLSQ